MIRALRKGRVITTATAIGAMIAVFAPAIAQAEPESPATDTRPGTTSPLDWQPCEDAPEGQVVDCATLEVPIDYKRLRRGTIEISLARRQATDPDQRIGTIVWNPGGPGGPGAELTKSYNPLTPQVAERFDIIGYDPRGVESSTPILCDLVLASAVWQLSDPTSQREFQQRSVHNTRYANDCRRRTGPLYDHVDNLHVVEDIERIRRAIGEGGLNFLGYSYGSLMGQQYAERYPENIRTMVLDGNMDHSLTTAWEFLSSETAPVEETFHQFAEWCDTTPECALHGVGDSTIDTYTELKERVRAGTITDPYNGEVLDFHQLTIFYTFAATYPPAWSELAEDFRAMLDGESRPSTLIDDPIIFNDPFTPMWCQDWDYPIKNYREWEDLKTRIADEYPIVEWTPYNDIVLTCAGYRGKTTNPQAPLEIDGAPPLVFIGNLYDPATVYSWTVAAAEQAGANLITYEGYGHTIYGWYSDCVNEAVDGYFIGLDVPDDGLRCPGLESPDNEHPDDLGVLSTDDVVRPRPTPLPY
jgi:pimeloyl-ACP methyl ester carboxylesterase